MYCYKLVIFSVQNNVYLDIVSENRCLCNTPVYAAVNLA